MNTIWMTAKKATAFIFYIGLPSQAAPTVTFQANATLAAGDAKVSIDGGALANLTTLPAVTPALGKLVKVSLSSAEMNGDNIAVVLADAAGAEWCDTIVNIRTSVNSADDIAGFIDTEVGAIYTRLGAPAGASVSADIAAVKTDTGSTATVIDSGALNKPYVMPVSSTPRFVPRARGTEL